MAFKMKPGRGNFPKTGHGAPLNMINEGPGDDTKNKKKPVSDNYFIINGKNKFKGWKCNLGLDHINIHQAGRISGNCGQFLYNKVGYYNFYDTNFVSNFSPIIQPVLCTQFSCNCGFETNVSKAIWIKQI